MGPKKPFSPFPAIEPQPRTLGDAMAFWASDRPDLDSCQVQGDLVLSGEGLRGKLPFQANLLYQRPARLRVRATRFMKTIFEILQIGDEVGILVNSENQIFHGTARELSEHPEMIGGVEPLEVIHAFLIGERFLSRVQSERAAGNDPGAAAFEDESRLIFAHRRPSADGLGGERLEEYVIRRREGLIEEARLYEPLGDDDWRLALVIEYTRWAQKDGRPYPARFEIRSTRPETLLRVEVNKTRFNPELDPRVFRFEPGPEVLPLSELFQGVE